MKKICTILIASAVISTASAFGAGLRKADGQPSVEGAWTMVFGDYYNDTASGDLITVPYNVTVNNKNVATFSPIDEQNYFEFKGTFDAENNTITFKKEYLGSYAQYYLYQIPIRYDDRLQDIVEITELVGTYEPSEGSIVFDEFFGIEWAGSTDRTGNQIAGYWSIYEIIGGYYFDTASSLEGTWQDVGMATFMDGWLVPAMNLNQQNYKYEVLLQQNVENPKRLRLVDPYLGQSPVAEYNGSEGGYIVFDISDPNHVVFLPCDAGFENSAIIQGGITQFYAYNRLGMLAVNQPDKSIQDIILTETGYIPFTTLEDGVVKLGSLDSPYDGLLYDANFGYQLNPFGGNSWGTQNRTVNMDASITFPEGFTAVDTIGAEQLDVKPEYFNLQGLRVINPQPGQLLIKRTGSKSVKVVY